MNIDLWDGRAAHDEASRQDAMIFGECAPTDAPWADMKCPFGTEDTSINWLIESSKALSISPRGRASFSQVIGAFLAFLCGSFSSLNLLSQGILHVRASTPG